MSLSIERINSGWRVGAAFAGFLVAFFALLYAFIAFTPSGLSRSDLVRIPGALALCVLVRLVIGGVYRQTLELDHATGMVRVRNAFTGFRWQSVRAIDVRLVRHNPFKRGINPLELRVDAQTSLGAILVLEDRIGVRQPLFTKIAAFVREHNPLVRVSLEG